MAEQLLSTLKGKTPVTKTPSVAVPAPTMLNTQTTDPALFKTLADRQASAKTPSTGAPESPLVNQKSLGLNDVDYQNKILAPQQANAQKNKAIAAIAENPNLTEEQKTAAIHDQQLQKVAINPIQQATPVVQQEYQKNKQAQTTANAVASLPKANSAYAAPNQAAAKQRSDLANAQNQQTQQLKNAITPNKDFSEAQAALNVMSLGQPNPTNYPNPEDLQIAQDKYNQATDLLNKMGGQAAVASQIQDQKKTQALQQYSQNPNIKVGADGKIIDGSTGSQVGHRDDILYDSETNQASKALGKIINNPGILDPSLSTSNGSSELLSDLDKLQLTAINKSNTDTVSTLLKRAQYTQDEYESSKAYWQANRDKLNSINEANKDSLLKKNELEANEKNASEATKVALMQDNNSRLEGFLKGQLSSMGLDHSAAGLTLMGKQMAAANLNLMNLEKEQTSVQQYYTEQARSIMNDYTQKSLDIGIESQKNIDDARNKFNLASNDIEANLTASENAKTQQTLSVISEAQSRIQQAKRDALAQQQQNFNEKLAILNYNHGVSEDAIKNNQWDQSMKFQKDSFDIGQKNELYKFNVGQQNQINMFNTGQSNELYKFDAQQTQQAAQFAQSLGVTKANSSVDNASKLGQLLQSGQISGDDYNNMFQSIVVPNTPVYPGSQNTNGAIQNDDGSTTVPTSASGSKFPITVKSDGSIDISGCPVGSKGGQCGHFVNDYLGDRVMGNSFESKMKATDPNIKVPQPGMVFVQPIKSGPAQPYGHTGIVVSVDTAKGTMQVKDSNYSNNPNDETVRIHTMPISAASGFVRPPNSAKITPNVSFQSPNNNGKMSFPENTGDNPNAFNPLATPQATEAISNPTSTPMEDQTHAKPNSGVPDRASQLMSAQSDNLDNIADKIAHYEQNPSAIQNLYASGDPRRQQLMQKIYEKNPDYNDQNYAANGQFLQDWKSGKSGTTGGANSAFNTAIKHLTTLSEAFNDLNNSGVHDMNSLENELTKHGNNAALQAFNSLKEGVAGEMGKAISGGGVTESELKSLKDIFSENSTPQEFKAVIDRNLELMGGKLQTNVERYKQNMGTYPKETLDQFTAQKLKKLGIDPSTFDPSYSGQSNSIPSTQDLSSGGDWNSL